MNQSHSSLIGTKFGRWTVTSNMIKEDNGLYCKCLCECKRQKIVLFNSLKYGRSLSCGCLNREILRKINAPFKHGKINTPEYRAWSSMKSRCSNNKDPNYQHYGKRGIKVSERWHKFENFLMDMGLRHENSSLDRINNNGDYCRENCRWASVEIQQNNRRSNRMIEFNGQRLSISQWARKLNMHGSVLYKRIKTGWSIEETLQTPRLMTWVR